MNDRRFYLAKADEIQREMSEKEDYLLTLKEELQGFREIFAEEAAHQDEGFRLGVFETAEVLFLVADRQLKQNRLEELEETLKLRFDQLYVTRAMLLGYLWGRVAEA